MRSVLKSGIHFRFFYLSPSGLCAVVIIALAVAIRVLLLALGWPPLDSDEATIGIMGIHIAFKGAWPIFFYGQSYMGAIEAYIAASMFRLFGVSTFTLLIGLVLLYAGFLWAIYRLTSLLYTRTFALVTIVLLTFGSNSMLSREMVALGGYPDTLLFGTLLLLLATWLALTSQRDKSARNRAPRLLAFAAWGLIAGLGLWTHMLILPFIAMSGLLLLCFCWRDVLSWAPLVLFLGLLLGSAPLIIYNLSAPPGKDTISVLLGIHSASGLALPPPDVLVPLQFNGAFLIALPLATGANPLCAPGQVKGIDLSSPLGLQCTLVHTGWSIGLVLLWCAAAFLALTGIWLARRNREDGAREARQERIRQSGRLALLVAALLTFMLYVVSPDAALFPIPTSRYLIGVLVATPAVLWPLWYGAHISKPLLLRASSGIKLVRTTNVLGRGIVAGVGSILLLGTFAVFTGFPLPPPVEQRQGIYTLQVNDQHLDVAQTRALNRKQYAFIDHLLQAHITRLYSDYWTCNRLIFQSRERIICSVLKDHLEAGHNRYLPYHAIVAADPRAAYAFQTNSLPAKLFAQRMRKDQRYRNYSHTTFDGYEVFQPR